jgi:hypothetical protein
MQYRPTAGELLDAVADLLEQEVLAVVPPELQHRVRVSANICRILQREADLGPALAEAERSRLAAVLPDAAAAHATAAELRAALSRRLDDPAPLEPAEQRAIYEALLAGIRDDLRISKPGYDEIGGGV